MTHHEIKRAVDAFWTWEAPHPVSAWATGTLPCGGVIVTLTSRATGRAVTHEVREWQGEASLLADLDATAQILLSLPRATSYRLETAGMGRDA